MTPEELWRLWELLDEIERLAQRGHFAELIDAINVTRRRIVEMTTQAPA